MQHTSFAAILGVISLFTLSTSAYAQSTGKLTLELLTHFQKVYSAASSADDKTAAEKAVNTIKGQLKQIDDLSILLVKSSEPTETEMAQVAEATAKLELEMRKQIETLAQNLKNKEVRVLLDPSMKQFASKAASARAIMDKLYPAQKMLPLVKAARARIQIQRSP